MFGECSTDYELARLELTATHRCRVEVERELGCCAGFVDYYERAEWRLRKAVDLLLNGDLRNAQRYLRDGLLFKRRADEGVATFRSNRRILAEAAGEECPN